MTGAFFWINVPFTEKKRRNKKQKKTKNFIILYILNNVFWYFWKHNWFKTKSALGWIFTRLIIFISFGFFSLGNWFFCTEWKLPISLFDKIFTIVSELIIKLTSIIFYILGYRLFSEFLFNFKTILLLDIFPSWTFD